MQIVQMLRRGFIFGVAASALSVAMGAFAQNASDIRPLNPPQPVENDGKVEVLEFFAYGCIHCANLEPRLERWVKGLPADVNFKRVPAILLSRGIDSVPIFYTLEAMGMLDKLHQKLFDAANVENVMLGHPPTLLKWLEKQGVNPAKYEEMQKSFSVQNKIARARKMNQDYRIGGTPAFVVDGRYELQTPNGSNGPERLFANIEQVIAQARAKMKTASAPAASADAKKK